MTARHPREPVATPREGTRSRPRRQSPEQTREDILVAAGRRFARAGYTAVTLNDIATDAGVTAPLVVHYYGSKRNLFRAVAKFEHSRAASFVDLDGPVETLGLQIARKCAEYLLDSDDTSALALVRSLDVEEARQLFAEEVERRITAPLAAVLPGPDAQLRARLIASQVVGFSLFAFGTLVDPDQPPPDPDTLERTVDVFAAGLQTYITPPSAGAELAEGAPRSA